MTIQTLAKTAMACLALAAGVAQASPTANVFLSGSLYLQGGSITDTNAGDRITMVAIAYSMGAAEDGIATWDNNGGLTLGGAVQSDFLPGSTQWGQTLAWAVNTADGGTFGFSGLDIDLIETYNPLSVFNGVIDDGAFDSLRNAYVQVTWSDGEVTRCALNRTAWNVDNGCSADIVNPIPEPASLLLAGLGLAAAGAARARRAKN